MNISRDNCGFMITSIELSPPTPAGLKGRMSDLLRMKGSVDSATAEISPERTD